MGMFVEYVFYCGDFGDVVGWGGGVMGVDVIDLVRIQVGIVQCVFYVVGGIGVVFWWCGYVEGVVVYVEVNQFGIDLCVVGMGVFQFFEYQGVGIVGQDEVVVILVLWMVGMGWFVVVSGECVSCVEIIQVEIVGSYFGIVGDYYVGFVIGDVVSSYVDVVGIGGVGGGEGVVGFLQIQVD